MIYADEMENKTKSDDPLTSNGISEIIWLYVIHIDDDTIFIMENKREYGFVDFFVYNKYIKMNRPDIEIIVAVYAMTSSLCIFTYMICKYWVLFLDWLKNGGLCFFSGVFIFFIFL